MNIALWVLQVLLALHTVMGAVWKFSNSEQTVPSLSAIPHGAWLALSVVEFALAAALVLPLVNKRLGRLAPLGAAGVAAEMLVFCAVFLVAGAHTYGELVYWLVVAGFCAFIMYGRLVLKPIAA